VDAPGERPVHVSPSYTWTNGFLRVFDLVGGNIAAIVVHEDRDMAHAIQLVAHRDDATGGRELDGLGAESLPVPGLAGLAGVR
jgi:hypothetical protein